MERHHLSALAVYAVTLAMAASAAVSFRSNATVEPIIRGPGISEIHRLSRWFPDLAGTPGDTDVYVLTGKEPGGSTLIEAGTASPHVFVILKGLVHAFQVDDRGRAERFAEGATQGIHLVDRRDLALTDERVEPAHRVTSRRATRGPMRMTIS